MRRGPSLRMITCRTPPCINLEPSHDDALATRKSNTKRIDATEAKLLVDLRELIETARMAIAQAVNSGQILLYWRIGERILTDILQNKRAAYGEEIVATVSRQSKAKRLGHATHNRHNQPV
jgi:DUF1016 N-terminal domain